MAIRSYREVTFFIIAELPIEFMERFVNTRPMSSMGSSEGFKLECLHELQLNDMSSFGEIIVSGSWSVQLSSGSFAGQITWSCVPPPGTFGPGIFSALN
ncbi:hypothetical protein PSACC_03414 [Paramicrosporidium saccamoebae]|uniref:Uncharacterized protein n=1 Tax=Paramicrosporidium saccamoebae TaxID=1246581 RepID=A0A2H9TG72_9FUNG|nr:hypothetical protein PSACC_03414 [Paramicrosporidium saccamoebae]